jgi:branched-chain amino acid aminotransferase
MKNYCYKDGKILTSDKIFVSAYDIGLLRGYGIYEGITAHGNKPFRLKDHLTRFRKSAKKLDIRVPLSDMEISNILDSLIRKNKFKRTNFRLILTGGNTIHGIEYRNNEPTFFILAEEWKPLPEDLYKKGGKLITEEYVRFEPLIKTTHYVTAVKLQKRRKAAKAIEILYVSDGNITECSTGNICMFVGDTLVTPKDSVLLGITRKAVLNISKKHFKTEERNVTLSELIKADEVFITGSYKDIVPIVLINKNTIGDGKPGKNTREIIRLFSELTKK